MAAIKASTFTLYFRAIVVGVSPDLTVWVREAATPAVSVRLSLLGLEGVRLVGVRAGLPVVEGVVLTGVEGAAARV